MLNFWFMQFCITFVCWMNALFTKKIFENLLVNSVTRLFYFTWLLIVKSPYWYYRKSTWLNHCPYMITRTHTQVSSLLLLYLLLIKLFIKSLNSFRIYGWFLFWCLFLIPNPVHEHNHTLVMWVVGTWKYIIN